MGHGAHAYTQLGSVYQNDPVLGIIEHLGLPTVCATCCATTSASSRRRHSWSIATNAGLIGISRLSWSLAGASPAAGVFARLHRRYRTPRASRSCLLFSYVRRDPTHPGHTYFLGNLYSYGAMLSFTIAHVAIIVLRVKVPIASVRIESAWVSRSAGAASR